MKSQWKSRVCRKKWKTIEKVVAILLNAIMILFDVKIVKNIIVPKYRKKPYFSAKLFWIKKQFCVKKWIKRSENYVFVVKNEKKY